MEQFERAQTVRLRSSHGKYLWAEEDRCSVSQERDSGEMAVWRVEVVEEHKVIRLKSAFDCYLTASDDHFLLGMTGNKVVQSKAGSVIESWTEWEPIVEQSQSQSSSRVRLKTRHGNYLRANGGIPPWRNSVTHDVPARTVTQSWLVWEVEIVESKGQQIIANSPKTQPLQVSQQLSFKIPKSDGRLISYAVVADKGEASSITAPQGEWPSFYFKGHTVSELTQALKQELGVPSDSQEELLVCTRHTLTGNLYQLHLGLPPNNAPMSLVVVKPALSTSP